MTGPTQATLDAWPNCSTPDCPNKVCLWLSREKCFPCATGVDRGKYEKATTKEERNVLLAEAGTLTHVRAAYNATHPRTWDDLP